MPVLKNLITTLDNIYDEVETKRAINPKDKSASRRISINGELWKVVIEWFDDTKRYVIRFDNITARFPHRTG